MAGAERDNVEVRRGRMRMSMHVMIQSGVTSCDWDAKSPVTGGSRACCPFLSVR